MDRGRNWRRSWAWCITPRRAEWPYDRKSHVGWLEKAWDEAARHGWTVTNMKAEWKKCLRSSREGVSQRGAGL
jgi:hypothetical protein